MKTKIIYPDPHDDYISIRDKILSSGVLRLLVVFPDKQRYLKHRLEFMLIRRAAEDAGIALGIVSSNPEIREMAASAEVSSFTSIKEAQKKAWKRKRNRRNFSIQHILFNRPKYFLEKICKKNSTGEIFQTRWLPKIILTIIILFFFLLLISYIPSAAIHLYPIKEDQVLAMEMRASVNIKTPGISGSIPAFPVSVQVEGLDEMKSSGEITVPESHAIGRVRFINISDLIVTVPAHTIVRTSGEPGYRFETLTAETIPAGIDSYGDVGVRAVMPGSSSNVKAGSIQSIEGEIGSRLKVQNPEKIDGGTDNQRASPTEKDIESLRNRMIISLEKTAIKELQGMATAKNQIVLEKLVKQKRILEEKAEPDQGQPGEKLTMKVRMEFEGLFVDVKSVEQIARVNLDAALPANKTALINPLDINQMEQPDLFEKDGSVRWNIVAHRKIFSKIDPDVVRNRLAGAYKNSIGQSLAKWIPSEKESSIELTPAWFPWLPIHTSRIQVKIE